MEMCAREFTMAKRAAAVSPAPTPLTSYKSRVVWLRALASQQRHFLGCYRSKRTKETSSIYIILIKVKKKCNQTREQTFVRRYVAQAAKAENVGAVNTQTVSTERGIFKELSILPRNIYVLRYSFRCWNRSVHKIKQTTKMPIIWRVGTRKIMICNTHHHKVPAVNVSPG